MPDPQPTEEPTSDIRTLIIDGQLWFSMVDILRSFGIDVSRRGASHQLRYVPPDHLRIVSRQEAPDIFRGRRGYSKMNFVSRYGAALLIKNNRAAHRGKNRDFV